MQCLWTKTGRALRALNFVNMIHLNSQILAQQRLTLLLFASFESLRPRSIYLLYTVHVGSTNLSLASFVVIIVFGAVVLVLFRNDQCFCLKRSSTSRLPGPNDIQINSL